MLQSWEWPGDEANLINDWHSNRKMGLRPITVIFAILVSLPEAHPLCSTQTRFQPHFGSLIHKIRWLVMLQQLQELMDSGEYHDIVKVQHLWLFDRISVKVAMHKDLCCNRNRMHTQLEYWLKNYCFWTHNFFCTEFVKEIWQWKTLYYI